MGTSTATIVVAPKEERDDVEIELPGAECHLATNFEMTKNGPTGLTVLSDTLFFPYLLCSNVGNGILLRKLEYPLLDEVVDDIHRSLSSLDPMGGPRRADGTLPGDWADLPFPEELYKAHGIGHALLLKSRTQLATLGSGNNFLKLYNGADGSLWLGVRTGSRAYGYGFSRKIEKRCKDSMKVWHIQTDFPWQRYIPLREFFLQYNLDNAVSYARLNRLLILRLAIENFSTNPKAELALPKTIYTSHTNYARNETIDGKTYFVTRSNTIRLGNTKRAGREGRDVGVIHRVDGSKVWIVTATEQDASASAPTTCSSPEELAPHISILEELEECV